MYKMQLWICKKICKFPIVDIKSTDSFAFAFAGVFWWLWFWSQLIVKELKKNMIISYLYLSHTGSIGILGWELLS